MQLSVKRKKILRNVKKRNKKWQNAQVVVEQANVGGVAQREVEKIAIIQHVKLATAPETVRTKRQQAIIVMERARSLKYRK